MIATLAGVADCHAHGLGWATDQILPADAMPPLMRQHPLKKMSDDLPIKPEELPVPHRSGALSDSRKQPLCSVGHLFPAAAGFSKLQLAAAFAIAGLSDVLTVYLTPFPPIVWTVDFVTAILLFIVLGWSWLLLPGLVMEAIPGLSVIPSWLLVVGAIAIWGTARPKVK